MMEQKNEKYERLELTVTEFDAEDVITTSVYYTLQEYEQMLPKMPIRRF